MKKVPSGTWLENPVAGQRALLVKLPAEMAVFLVRTFNLP